MKIALGSRPFDGPWGGGNRFIAALAEGLEAAGHTIVYDLRERDLDIILLTDPRVRSPNVMFGAGAIFRTLLWRNRQAIVVHRINECDERKNEAFINDRLVRANAVADATVFVGQWLTQLAVWRENMREPCYVIRNGSDARLFHAQGFQPWSGVGPLKLVTHHWGYHVMKGFDVYERIDALLDDAKWRERIAFTYIGNLPKGFSFKHARYVPPLDGEALAQELRSHHAYVTGSQNEPGGNHQNEGALCGLPLLYRDSGCMPEYCDGFGVRYFGLQDVEAGLEALMSEYGVIAGRMKDYPHTAEKMVGEWLALFSELVEDRAAILARRQLWRDLKAVVLNQVPM